MPHETQSQLPTLLDLVAKLLYGSGLCIMEAIRLRVKDIDFPMQQLTVCSGKSDLDHFITLRLAAGRSTLHRLSHRDQASDVGSAANHLRRRGSTRSSVTRHTNPVAQEVGNRGRSGHGVHTDTRHQHRRSRTNIGAYHDRYGRLRR
jgi:integrase